MAPDPWSRSRETCPQTHSIDDGIGLRGVSGTASESSPGQGSLLAILFLCPLRSKPALRQTGTGRLRAVGATAHPGSVMGTNVGCLSDGSDPWTVTAEEPLRLGDSRHRWPRRAGLSALSLALPDGVAPQVPRGVG